MSVFICLLLTGCALEYGSVPYGFLAAQFVSFLLNFIKDNVCGCAQQFCPYPLPYRIESRVHAISQYQISTSQPTLVLRNPERNKDN